MIQEKGQSNYINQSGIYDVSIIAPFVNQGHEQSMGVDFFIEYNGQKQPLYGNLRLTNRDGSENFSAKIFNKLLVIADVDAVADPIEAELPIGKDGANKDVAVLEDLADIDCKVQIQMEYGIYNGDITEKKIIRNFFRTDGATAEEIVNDTEPGKQLEKSLEFADKNAYKDGLDEEAVNSWIAANRPKGTAGGSSTPTKKPSFGKPKSKFAK